MKIDESKSAPILGASLISRVDVEDLFYTYSYRLGIEEIDSGEGGLMLLYGSNGSGKTTILNMIYHLLHPDLIGGHRTFWATFHLKDSALLCQRPKS